MVGTKVVNNTKPKVLLAKDITHRLMDSHLVVACWGHDQSSYPKCYKLQEQYCRHGHDKYYVWFNMDNGTTYRGGDHLTPEAAVIHVLTDSTDKGEVRVLQGINELVAWLAEI